MVFRAISIGFNSYRIFIGGCRGHDFSRAHGVGWSLGDLQAGFEADPLDDESGAYYSGRRAVGFARTPSDR